MLVSLPHGVPLRIAIPALLLCGTALAAQALLAAMLQVMPAAAGWLRSTPLGHAALLRALCRRGRAWQGAAALGACLLLVALGVAAPRALGVGAIWLAWCATALAATWLRRLQPRRARIEVRVLGVLLLAVAGVAWPLLPAVLPALWIWQWRRMAAE